MTGLPEMPGGPHRYRAPDFDTLTDSPIVVGNPAVYEFTVDGKKHYLVNEGEGGIFDGARAAKDLEAIVREHRRMWGSLPYDRYLFLNMLTESGGGLEHKNSSVLMGSRWATRTRRAYNTWLDLASHEFFHVWNVKRLRPEGLGPYDFTREAHTPCLWFAEGFTEYYSEIVTQRAGLCTRQDLLYSFAETIERLHESPGRLKMSIEEASWTTWHFGDDRWNAALNYYLKGSLLGLACAKPCWRAPTAPGGPCASWRWTVSRSRTPPGATCRAATWCAAGACTCTPSRPTFQAGAFG
jgi:predicted metalloprotease with PDZ domain